MGGLEQVKYSETGSVKDHSGAQKGDLTHSRTKESILGDNKSS
jgi:hypothetical protein